MLSTKMFLKPYFSIAGQVLCNRDRITSQSHMSLRDIFLLEIFAGPLCPRTRFRKLLY